MGLPPSALVYVMDAQAGSTKRRGCPRQGSTVGRGNFLFVNAYITQCNILPMRKTPNRSAGKLLILSHFPKFNLCVHSFPLCSLPLAWLSLGRGCHSPRCFTLGRGFHSPRSCSLPVKFRRSNSNESNATLALAPMPVTQL
jgi:hypothetical protein